MTTFSAAARWIWTADESSTRNFWLRMRRSFASPSSLKRATLLITADSRYQLFVNGHDVGNGPVRSFPWAYSYDEYDITAWLQAGAENVIAARVVQWGDYTFQYITGRGGFLSEIILETHEGQVERIVSDADWQVAPDPVTLSHTPRISTQQGFEEQIDARAEDGWQSVDYTPNGWSQAHIVGPVGTDPWKELLPRTIPFLQLDPVLPTTILAAELAQLPSGYRWCFDLRHRVKDLTIGLRAEALGEAGLAFATEIIATRDCEVTLATSNANDYLDVHVLCNGQRIQTSAVELRAGRNLFVVTHTDWPSLYFQTSEPLEFDASRIVAGNVAAPWAYLGPFDERALYDPLYAARDVAQLPDVPRLPIDATETMDDIYLLTKAQRFLVPPNGFCDPSIARPQPRETLTRAQTPFVEQLPLLLHENANYALLYPQADGDIHLVIDFGRELCGFPVLELEAAEGTIVDANFFEGIDGGGIFWTEGLRNSFRYICRAGYQQFRSHQRRGFRYAALTFRIQGTEPVKLYNVRCLLNTYPVEQQGSFACSDALLTTIWERAAYTVQLCMDDTYLDCPAYEQVFWVGDARNSALVNAVAFGAYPLTDRSLHLTAASLSPEVNRLKPPQRQQRTHLTTDHVASGWFSEIPMWTFLWIWNVWEHYQITGDRTALIELYPAVRECLERCLSFLSPRGLFNIPDVWNMVDWSANDMTRDGEVTASSALLVESLRKAVLMAEALAAMPDQPVEGLHNEISQYRSAAERVFQAINTYCWSEEREAYVDTVRDEQGYAYHVELTQQYGLSTDTREQFLARTRISEHTNTLILLCHCAPADRADRIVHFAEAAKNGQFIGSHTGEAPSQPPEQIVPVGSPWFLFFTLETLLVLNQVETVINLIREQWGRMIEKGATTFWETFPNLNGTHWSRSLCHGWSAAPAYFLSTQLLGVQPTTPGYRSVSIAPQLCGLNWAHGSVPTPQGQIHVDWSRDAAGWRCKLDLPASVSGELVMPRTGTEPPVHVAGVQGQIIQERETWRIVFSHGGFSHYHCV